MALIQPEVPANLDGARRYRVRLVFSTTILLFHVWYLDHQWLQCLSTAPCGSLIFFVLQKRLPTEGAP